MLTQTKCGYIAIIGRPNVGKSTLLNHILGTEISIVTKKPHTTRTPILGNKTTGAIQAIYFDTPGMQFKQPKLFQRQLNRLAYSVLPNADIIVFVVEALQWQQDDERLLKKITAAVQDNTRTISLLAINKVDLVNDKTKLLPFIAELQQKFSFKHIVPISACYTQTITRLEDIIHDCLPVLDHILPANQLTDQPIQQQVTEIIRKYLMMYTGQELPYSTTVTISAWQVMPKLISIVALILVQRPGQKIIVIGQNGNKIKTIGTYARCAIEKLLQTKVMLNLWVKVKAS